MSAPAMGAVTRARILAPILGAVALLCLVPAVALGRHGDDADTQAIALVATEHGPGEHGRRPFITSPGHQERPARNVAPGHQRTHGKTVSEERPSVPAGEVLGATPRPATRTSTAPPHRDAQGTGLELDATGSANVGSDVVQMPPIVALGNAPQRASALGAVLGVTAAFSPAFGDLTMPVLPDRLGGTLVVLILCSQVLAAALLSSAVPQILGAFGSPRLH